MKNENDFDEELYVRSANSVHSGLASMWDAGASTENITDVLRNALEEIGITDQILL